MEYPTSLKVDFCEREDFLKQPPGYTPVLEGTLIKKVNGKEIAKENLKFKWQSWVAFAVSAYALYWLCFSRLYAIV